MLWKKLRLKEGTKILTINAPAEYKKSLGTVPKGVTITNKPAKGHDFIQLFVKNKKEMERDLPKTVKILNPDGLIWISYPKGSSGIQTDLTRDKGWESLEKIKMQWLALISFDDNWSAFLMKNSKPKEQTRASKEYHANQNKFADPKTKTVVIPDDLKKAFVRNKKAETVYNGLNYTGRKEYMMWIIGAKREETRAERVKKTIEKLLAGKKTPVEK